MKETKGFNVRGDDLKMNVLVLANVIIPISFCTVMTKRMRKIYWTEEQCVLT
jgi:hypothetical protein